MTAGDPTMLYLSDRKGWLISPKDISKKTIIKFKEKGAKYISGSWEVIESYNKFSDEKVKSNINKILCNSSNSLETLRKGCQNKDTSYLIELN